MAATALATRGDQLPDASTWATMLEMADVLVKSGMLPSAIKSPAAALAIIEKGRELGIPAMYALNNIAVINGRAVTGAELMLALIYRDHGDLAIQFEDTTDQGCVVLYKRRGWSAPRRFEWGEADARKAGLLSKGGTWKEYPTAMYRHRCISAVARLAFPDSIGGLYTPEEMGAEVRVTENGDVEVVPETAPVMSIVATTEPTTAETTSPEPKPAPRWDRAEAEARYAFLAGEAIKGEHPKSDKIRETPAASLSDGVLKASIASLEAFLADVEAF